MNNDAHVELQALHCTALVPVAGCDYTFLESSTQVPASIASRVSDDPAFDVNAESKSMYTESATLRPASCTPTHQLCHASWHHSCNWPPHVPKIAA